MHLGTNTPEKLRGFPGGRATMNPIYIVSTAHWDVTFLFWTLDIHPKGPHLLTYPVPQEKMYLAIHLALISQFHFFPSSYLTESILQVRSFQQHFHSKCKRERGKEWGLLQLKHHKFWLFIFILLQQKLEKGKKLGKKILICNISKCKWDNLNKN